MTGLRQISLVVVPVSDQPKSVDFYVEKLGLEKRVDSTFGDGYRWVEVYCPQGSTGISVATPPPGTPVVAQATGITFQSDDLESTHAELLANGVDVDAEITRMGGPVPDMFWFRDPDGHSLLVVKTPN